jgi:hypothetical protein
MIFLLSQHIYELCQLISCRSRNSCPSCAPFSHLVMLPSSILVLLPLNISLTKLSTFPIPILLDLLNGTYYTKFKWKFELVIPKCSNTLKLKCSLQMLQYFKIKVFTVSLIFSKVLPWCRVFQFPKLGNWPPVLKNLFSQNANVVLSLCLYILIASIDFLPYRVPCFSTKSPRLPAS